MLSNVGPASSQVVSWRPYWSELFIPSRKIWVLELFDKLRLDGVLSYVGFQHAEDMQWCVCATWLVGFATSGKLQWSMLSQTSIERRTDVKLVNPGRS